MNEVKVVPCAIKKHLKNSKIPLIHFLNRLFYQLKTPMESKIERETAVCPK